MKLKIIGEISAAILIVVAFQNCSQDMQSASPGQATSASESVSSTSSDCMVDGKTVPFGSLIQAYFQKSVPYGSSCSNLSEIRVCGNNGLTGSAPYASCVVQPPASCTFNGKTIAGGATVLAYAHSSVPYGQSCGAVALKCNNGVLSPNPAATPYASCAVGAPAACQVAGTTLAHGATKAFYTKSSVGYGDQCPTVNVSCSNGTPSTTQTVYTSCNMSPPIIKWVQAQRGEKHLQTCSRVGLFPSVDKGYGICASGENRPAQGTDASKISYSYGTWGSHKVGGTKITAGYGAYYCYHSGQKKDSDGSDLLVAYLCSQVQNTVDTSPTLLTPPPTRPRDFK